MVNRVRYTEEFKAEAVEQVLERGFKVVEVAPRVGVPVHTLYGRVQRARGRLKGATSRGNTRACTREPSTDRSGTSA